MHYQLLGETITFGYPFEYSHRWQIAVAGILTNLSGMQLHMRIVLGIIILNIFLFDFRTELVWFCYSLLSFSNNLSIYISAKKTTRIKLKQTLKQVSWSLTGMWVLEHHFSLRYQNIARIIETCDMCTKFLVSVGFRFVYTTPILVY